MENGEFFDPRLVMVYDAQCLWSRDDEFFLAQVNEIPGARVLDMGCGTGRLTVALAVAGHQVTGVDPARASLEVARRKPDAGKVTWIEGSCDVLPERCFDVAVMTSHVAQFLVSDEEWEGALAALNRSLVPGGRLVFDSRDPANRQWEQWNPVDSHRRVTLPDGRMVQTWTKVTAVDDGVVGFTHYYEFPDETLVSTATMRFRTEEELRASLGAAGFTIDQIYGGWHREPVGASDGEFLVLARA